MLFSQRREDCSEMDDVVDFVFFDDVFVLFLVSNIKLVVLAVKLRVTFHKISCNNLVAAEVRDQGFGEFCSDLSSATCHHDCFVFLYGMSIKLELLTHCLWP